VLGGASSELPATELVGLDDIADMPKYPMPAALAKQTIDDKIYALCLFMSVP
jgi:hypothetical protein